MEVQKPIPTFACEYCGAVTQRRMCRYANGRATGYDYAQRFCSRECGYKGRAWRPINFEGHRRSDGYYRVNLGAGTKQYKHRIVMEELLGRSLRRDEHVHHKDGNRGNCSPDNLELWTKRHPFGQRVTDKVAFAIEILRLYPEFARRSGVALADLVHD